ncbi:MAG: metal ABC transporter permease [Microbacteriaceae bacterium]|jgi:zinc/manganese transport system permease protein|nr:metal ABC transporter permease [Microbacteriaceae bacterium]
MPTLFDFSDYDRLIPLVTNSLIAGALLALVGGLIGVFVITRQLSFAVHGVAELSFAGAAIFLLIGLDVVLGSIVGSITAAVIIGTLGSRVQERNSLVAVIMPFGLGLGILALSLYPGRAANKFGLLTGQIVTVDDPQVSWLIAISVSVLIAIAVFWRPLVFASLDSSVAIARGVKVNLIGWLFMILLGLVVAAAVQIIGALLVLSLLVTPAAAALRLSSSQVWVPVMSISFAMVSVVGGILLALGGGLPISPYVTTISFLFYLVARVLTSERFGILRVGGK